MTWVATIVTVLFLTPLFTTLPEAVLAALIIHAVWHIIASRKLQRVRAVSRSEFWLGALALAGVLLIDVLEGMIIGLVASLVFVIYRSSRPHLSSLGRVPGVPGAYSDLGRHPENLPVPGVLIVRLDAPCTTPTRSRCGTECEPWSPRPTRRWSSSTPRDRTSSTSPAPRCSPAMVKSLQAGGITLYVAQAHDPVLEAADPAGLDQLIGAESSLPTLDAAVRAAEAFRCGTDSRESVNESNSCGSPHALRYVAAASAAVAVLG